MADAVAVGGLVLGAIGTGISIYNWRMARHDRREQLAIEVSLGSCTIRNLSVFPVEVTSIRVERPGRIRIGEGILDLPITMPARTSRTFRHSIAETLYQQVSQVSVRVTTGTGKEFVGKAPPPTVAL